MPAVATPIGAPMPVHPLDQMSWNDRVWTPQQAEFLRNSGMSLIDALIDTDFEPERAAISNTIKRWPGDTDGDSSRSHLVVPYRMHEGTAFQGVDQTAVRAYILSTMAEVGTDYMNGCIEFVDDTDAQGKSYFNFTSHVIINAQDTNLVYGNIQLTNFSSASKTLMTVGAFPMSDISEMGNLGNNT